MMQDAEAYAILRGKAALRRAQQDKEKSQYMV